MDNFKGEAFDIVTEHIQWTLPTQERVRKILLENLHQGAWNAKKKLEPVWPPEAEFSWPAGAEFLERTKKRVKPMDYAELLRLTVSRLAHRMGRREQILSMLEGTKARQRWEYVYIGDYFDPAAVTECGILGLDLYSSEVFLENPPQACDIVGCRCDIGTWRQRDVDAYRKRSSSN